LDASAGVHGRRGQSDGSPDRARDGHRAAVAQLTKPGPELAFIA
jgi:hypothetical protein